VKPLALCFTACALLLSAGLAHAGDPPKSGDAPPAAGATPATDAPAAGTSTPPAAGADANAKKTPSDDEKYGTNDDGSKAHAADKTKFYLGARFRDFVAPAFMFHLFADGGPGAVNVFSGGPELMVLMGSLETIVSITVPYADYSMNEFVFKSKSDPDQAYEIVSSSLKLVTASVDLLGRIKFDKKGTVAFLIGGGVGLSGVIGDIRRDQAYPDDPDNVDPNTTAKWHKCTAPNSPPVTTPDGHAYCGNDNDHYPDKKGNDYSEPYWTDGGSKPVIFPYVALPHLAIEVTPIEQLMLRVDTGFSLTGFFFGLAAGGKLPI